MSRALFLLLCSALAAVAAAAAPAQAAAPPAMAEAGYLRIGRQGIAYLPDRRSGQPLPLLVLFHGAGSTAEEIMRPLIPETSARGLALLAIQSTAETWDLVVSRADIGAATRLRSHGGLPPGDRRSTDEAIDLLQRQTSIDPKRIGAFGFSDGASYALSIGAAEPERFSFVAGFSPGFALIPPGKAHTGQRVFIAHGRQDSVLPFQRSRDATCPDFLHSGWIVRFRAFEGEHVINLAVLHEALDEWLVPASRPAVSDRSYNCDR